MLVLPYCDEEGARVAAGRIIKRLEESNQNDSINLTISLGVAFLKTDAVCDDSKELVKLADKALYTAKANGKNQICIETFI